MTQGNLSPIQQLASEIEPLGYTIRQFAHPSNIGQAWFIVREDSPNTIYEPYTYAEGIERGAHGEGGRFWYAAVASQGEESAANHLRFTLKRHPLTVIETNLW